VAVAVTEADCAVPAVDQVFAVVAARERSAGSDRGLLRALRGQRLAPLLAHVRPTAIAGDGMDLTRHLRFILSLHSTARGSWTSDIEADARHRHHLLTRLQPNSAFGGTFSPFQPSVNKFAGRRMRSARDGDMRTPPKSGRTPAPGRDVLTDPAGHYDAVFASACMGAKTARESLALLGVK
jgi:hypothetical protein